MKMSLGMNVNMKNMKINVNKVSMNSSENKKIIR